MKKRPLPHSSKLPGKTLWQRHIEAVKSVEVADKAKDFTPKQLREMKNSEFFRHFGFSKRKMPSLLKNMTKAARMAREAQKRRFKRLNIMQEREKRILSMMLDDNLNFKEVGDIIGITRERVRQIVMKIEMREGIKVARPGHNKKKGSLRTAAHCFICNAIVEVIARHYNPKKNYRCEKHKHIRMKDRRLYDMCPEWPNMTTAQRQSWRYHNDPVWRERHAKSVAAYHKRVQGTDEYKAKQRAYLKEYHARKLKENPNYFKDKETKRKERKAAEEEARLTELRARMGLIHSDKNDI